MIKILISNYSVDLSCGSCGLQFSLSFSANTENELMCRDRQMFGCV